jgi:hypothetical protein
MMSREPENALFYAKVRSREKRQDSERHRQARQLSRGEPGLWARIVPRFGKVLAALHGGFELQGTGALETPVLKDKGRLRWSPFLKAGI